MLLDSIKQIELTQPFDFFSQVRDASAFNFQASMCIVVPEENCRGTHALQNEHTGAQKRCALVRQHRKQCAVRVQLLSGTTGSIQMPHGRLIGFTVD